MTCQRSEELLYSKVARANDVYEIRKAGSPGQTVSLRKIEREFGLKTGQLKHWRANNLSRTGALVRNGPLPGNFRTGTVICYFCRYDRATLKTAVCIASSIGHRFVKRDTDRTQRVIPRLEASRNVLAGQTTQPPHQAPETQGKHCLR